MVGSAEMAGAELAKGEHSAVRLPSGCYFGTGRIDEWWFLGFVDDGEW